MSERKRDWILIGVSIVPLVGTAYGAVRMWGKGGPVGPDSYDALRETPHGQNPLKPEERGGPRLTDQTPRRGNENGGRKVESKGSSDDQERRRNPFDDEDDDFTGGSGASDETPVALGGVDPGFDTMPFVYGGTAIAILLVVYLLSRGRSFAPAY